MEGDTALKDHWILDREHSNEQVKPHIFRIIIDSLEAKVDERKKYLQNSNTNIEFDSNNDFLKIPKFESFNSDYYNNYIGKSQNWVGHVIEIMHDKFTAKLQDSNYPGTYEIANFEMEEISQGDKDLLTLGAIFYWSVGFAYEKGQVSKKSIIRFKRSAYLSENDIDNIADRASFFDKNINWDD